LIAIFKKELKSYFTSFIGYIFLVFFFLTISFNFYGITVQGGSGLFTYTLHSSTIIFLILIPTLTMRLFSDEKKNKTDQLLYTSPIKVSDIVIGKYLSAVALFLIGFLIVSMYPLLIYTKGSLNVNETLGSMFGYVLLISSFIAVGIFISSLSDNQMASAIGTFGVLFAIYMTETIASVLPQDNYRTFMTFLILALFIAVYTFSAYRNIYLSAIVLIFLCGLNIFIYSVNVTFYDQLLFKMVTWFSLIGRFSYFTVGIFSLSNIVFYISFIFALLYLTVHTIEKRRWT